MLKRDLIGIVLNLLSAITDKSNGNNELLEQIHKFNNNFSNSQSEMAVIKQVNAEITKPIVTLERQCSENTQYFRKECMEVVGIHRQMVDKLLETKKLSIFEQVG